MILVLVMLSIAVIMAAGYPTVDRMQENVETERMVNEMAVLDADIGNVAMGGASSKNVRMNTGGGTLSVDGDASWIHIKHYDQSGNLAWEHNSSMGTVEYRNNDRLIAYEGGGVWNTQVGDEGSSMLTPPEFRYRGSTLTFPLINISGDMSYSGRAGGNDITVKQEEMKRVYPDGLDETNPVDNGTVNVTVHSRYYQGWANHFEERTEGNVVSIDEENRTAEVELTIEASETFDSAIESGGAGKELVFGQGADVAAYNSDDGYPPPSESLETHINEGHEHILEDGEIKASGNIDLRNTVRVWGNLFSEQDISLSHPSNELHGDATAGAEIDIHGNAEHNGNVYEDNDSVDIDSPFPADEVISHELEAAIEDNDNDDHDCVQGDEFDIDDGCTLDASSEDTTIYIDASANDRELNNDELEIDISDGNVTIAVDGPFEAQSFEISITGDSPTPDENTVDWYFQGSVELHQTNVTNDISEDNYAAYRNMWMIPEGESIEFGGGSDPVFVGIVYAPDGSMDINNNVIMYGAAIVDNSPSNPMNQMDFYFDQSLMHMEIPLLDPGVAITYLHISENRVSIE